MQLFFLLRDGLFKCLFLFLIGAILVFIPLKILSYGWSSDFGMLLSSALVYNSDIPTSHSIIKECIQNQIPIYTVVAENTLIFVTLTTFLLFNIIGICYSTNVLAWFTALSVMFLLDNSLISRLLNSSPLILISMLFIVISLTFTKPVKNYPLTATIILVSAILLVRVLIFPKIFTFNSMNLEYDYFWKECSIELPYLFSFNGWIFFMPFVIWLSAYKKQTAILTQLGDSFLFIALSLQLAMNFGFIDLITLRDTFVLIWLTESISELIPHVGCFKEPRVKYCLGLFILTSFVLLATHDGNGRFSKTATHCFPIDFSLAELKAWAPQEGSILYSDDPAFAISQHYYRPKADYIYYHIDNNKIPLEEKKNLIKIQSALRNRKTPLPEYYDLILEKMKPGDRLITSAKINGIENVDWLKLNKYWIARPKKLSPISY